MHVEAKIMHCDHSCKEAIRWYNLAINALQHIEPQLVWVQSDTNVDSPIWYTLWFNTTGAPPPKWFINPNIHHGINMMLQHDQCEEEEVWLAAVWIQRVVEHAVCTYRSEESSGAQLGIVQVLCKYLDLHRHLQPLLQQPVDVQLLSTACNIVDHSLGAVRVPAPQHGPRGLHNIEEPDEEANMVEFFDDLVADGVAASATQDEDISTHDSDSEVEAELLEGHASRNSTASSDSSDSCD
ncbi:hypothetical protein DACRYDRAFT_18432 [Dacryopinax primogenitus]|uniref:Uncharacterized protein n=1 Tax=Dacryopinax primogenitus (strain DJM 731) TaxID=1858805 RepID=M5FS25_DACPD|nr:uncharacterized protein DACRYDRAFT_18432 [Dacryopinax primogenitus]EJT97919.1 hypothetical protein DACRYDRAFT_18432 [Dacryopinax primogenitus]